MSKPPFTRRSAANRLASSASIAGLILGQTITPAMAQNYLDIFNRPSDGRHVGWSMEASSASMAYHHLYEAHAQMREQVRSARIRPLPSTGTYQTGDGRHRFLPIELHLQQYSGSVRNFYTEDGHRLYAEDRHGRFEILSRICSDDPLVELNGIELPSRSFQYTIVTYMRVLPVALDRPEQVFGMASYNNQRPMGGFLNSIPAYFTPQRGIEGVNGDAIPIPDCITDAFINDYYGPYPALVSTLSPGQIQTAGHTRTEIEERPGQCPPEGAPDDVIGTARYERSYFEPVYPIIDADGNNLLTANPNQAAWTYVNGCRAPWIRQTPIRQECTRTIAGQPNVVSRAWKAWMREVVPERGYYLDGEPIQYEPIGTAETTGTPYDWELVVDLCAPDTVTPQLVKVETPLNERETNLTCPSTHPLGTWDRERDGTSTNFSLPDTNFEPWDLVVWDDWRTTRNDCHTTSTSSSVEYNNSGCQTSRRNVSTTTTSYHDGRAPISNTSYGAWVYDNSNCNSGGGSGERSLDTNGDGIGDMRIGDPDAPPGSRVVDGDCGACNGPGESSSDRSDDGKVICTELMRQELISREDYVLCARHSYATLSEAHFRGYHVWAVPVVKWMRKSPHATRAWRVLAQARMNDIAYKTGHRATPDHFGRTLNFVGEPLCWLIGQFVGATDYAAHLYAKKETNHDLA